MQSFSLKEVIFRIICHQNIVTLHALQENSLELFNKSFTRKPEPFLFRLAIHSGIKGFTLMYFVAHGN
ncbi:hypothetical protein D041_4556 [Vibrio parahaemolyticus EKP-008]|nr:hypothetical protein D041_4556 [Vibrio parahaemolyticus EKP-008]